MSTVIGTFQSRDEAEQAVNQLRDRGFTEDEISIVARDEVGPTAAVRWEITPMVPPVPPGRVLGGAAGLLADRRDYYPELAPSWRGALGSGFDRCRRWWLAGGLLDMGIPNDRGEYYEGEVKKGRVLAAVETDSEMVEEAAQVLREFGASDVEVH